MINLAPLLTLADKLHVLETVKEKLLRQTDPALDKLRIVVEEIMKISDAIDDELKRYFSLYFEPGEGLSDERQILIGLDGAQILARAAAARGHSHKIARIYTRYLQRWFHDILNPREAADVAELFDLLSGADSMIVQLVYDLAQWIPDEARDVLRMVDANDFMGANARIKGSYEEVRLNRRALHQAQALLYDLEDAFADGAGQI